MSDAQPVLTDIKLIAQVIVKKTMTLGKLKHRTDVAQERQSTRVLGDLKPAELLHHNSAGRQGKIAPDPLRLLPFFAQTARDSSSEDRLDKSPPHPHRQTNDDIILWKMQYLPCLTYNHFLKNLIILTD